MQPSSTRSGVPWLRQGLIFGALLGLIRIIILIIGSFIHLLIIGAMIDFFLVPFLFLVGGVYAGLRASQQTGKMSTGILAGLVAGLFAALIYFFALSIYIAVLLNSTGHKVAPLVFFSPSGALVLLFSILPALVAGLVGGIIGGAVGSSERRTPPGTTTPSSTGTSTRKIDQPLS